MGEGRFGDDCPSERQLPIAYGSAELTALVTGPGVDTRVQAARLDCCARAASGPSTLRYSLYHWASARPRSEEGVDHQRFTHLASQNTGYYYGGDRTFTCTIDDLARRWRKAVRQAIRSVGASLIFLPKQPSRPESDRAVRCQAEAWRRRAATRSVDAVCIATASVRRATGSKPGQCHPFTSGIT